MNSYRIGISGLVVSLSCCAPVNQADRGKVHADESVDAPISDRDGDGDPDSTDCAPEDSAVHDGAEELCNGIDDDCDGEVDEGTTGYVDADGDGFGALDALVSWCDAPDGAGLAEESGDCDDDDRLVHPGADDPPCDGLDQDCDRRGEYFYTTGGGRYETLDEALADVEDGAEVMVCAGTHPTHAALTRPISVTIAGETGNRGEVELDGQGAGTILYLAPGAVAAMRDLSMVNGRGDVWTDTEEGGAIAMFEATAELSNVAFIGNSASQGAAIVMYQDMDGDGGAATLRLHDALFEENMASLSGGALHVRGFYDAATIEISNTRFRQNTADQGYGGVLSLSGFGPTALTVTSTVFEENSAGVSGGAIDSSGFGDVSIELDEVVLVHNYADYGGGALAVGGHGRLDLALHSVLLEDNFAGHIGGAATVGGPGDLSAIVRDSSFIDNQTGSGDGGGLELGPHGSGVAELSGVVFSGNEAGGDGGALKVSPQGAMDVALSECSFTGNRAGWDGGAVRLSPQEDLEFRLQASEIHANQAHHDGGGLMLSVAKDVDVNVFLDEVDVTDNTASENAGGLKMQGPTASAFADSSSILEVEVSNSTIDGNTSGNVGGALFVNGHRPTLLMSNVTLTANQTGARRSCAVHLQMTASVMADDVHWGFSGDENAICDVVDTPLQVLDLMGVESVTCVEGACSAE